MSLSAIDPGVQRRLTPQVAQFEQRYREVEVRSQPTTSGWTWLFLAWAVSNGSQNNTLEADNAAMKARMGELERELRTRPSEWGTLQTLAEAGPAQSFNDGDVVSASDVERDETGEPVQIGSASEETGGEGKSTGGSSAASVASGSVANPMDQLASTLSSLLLPAGVLSVAVLGFMIGIRPLIGS